MLTQYNEQLYPEQFFCPKCFNRTPYGIKCVSVKTHFYYIPLFASDHFDHVVECKVCKRGFDPSVLLPRNQVLIRIAMAIRTQMRKGFPVESLTKELQDAGYQGELADKLISLAQV